MSAEEENECTDLYSWSGFSNAKPTKILLNVQSAIVHVSLGEKHSAFLTNCGQVFMSGANDYGQCGIGEISSDTISQPASPEALAELIIIDIACGKNHTVAISIEGCLYSWGDSTFHQCGLGGVGKYPYPLKLEVLQKQIGNLEANCLIDSTDLDKVRFCQVSCGSEHSVAVSQVGEIWVWGSGMALGLAALREAVVPTCVEYLRGRMVLAVSCGKHHSVAIVETPIKHNLNVKKTDPKQTHSTLTKRHSLCETKLRRPHSSQTLQKRPESRSVDYFSFDDVSISKLAQDEISSQNSSGVQNRCTISELTYRNDLSQEEILEESETAFTVSDKAVDAPQPEALFTCGEVESCNEIKINENEYVHSGVNNTESYESRELKKQNIKACESVKNDSCTASDIVCGAIVADSHTSDNEKSVQNDLASSVCARYGSKIVAATYQRCVSTDSAVPRSKSSFLDEKDAKEFLQRQLASCAAENCDAAATSVGSLSFKNCQRHSAAEESQNSTLDLLSDKSNSAKGHCINKDDIESGASHILSSSLPNSQTVRETLARQLESSQIAKTVESLLNRRESLDLGTLIKRDLPLIECAGKTSVDTSSNKLDSSASPLARKVESLRHRVPSSPVLVQEYVSHLTKSVTTTLRSSMDKLTFGAVGGAAESTIEYGRSLWAGIRGGSKELREYEDYDRENTLFTESVSRITCYKPKSISLCSVYA